MSDADLPVNDGVLEFVNGIPAVVIHECVVCGERHRHGGRIDMEVGAYRATKSPHCVDYGHPDAPSYVVELVASEVDR